MSRHNLRLSGAAVRKMFPPHCRSASRYTAAVSRDALSCRVAGVLAIINSGGAIEDGAVRNGAAVQRCGQRTGNIRWHRITSDSAGRGVTASPIAAAADPLR